MRHFNVEAFDQDFVWSLRNAEINYDTDTGVLSYGHELGYSEEFRFLDASGNPLTDYTIYEAEELIHFHHPVDDLNVASIRYERPTEGYEPVVDGLKTIDTATYEQLTPSFQRKYKKIKGDDVAVAEPMELKVRHHNQPFSLEVYNGGVDNVIKRKQRNLERYDSPYRELHPGFHNFTKAHLTQQMIVLLLQDMYQDRANQGEGREHVATFHSFRSSWNNDDSSRLKVMYFAEPWDGEMRKEYDRKRNGGIYADRRGKMVPVYPDTASVVEVSNEDLLAIPFDDCANNEEQYTMLEVVYNTLFVNHD